MLPKVKLERLSHSDSRIYLEGFGDELSICYYSEGRVLQMGVGYYIWDLSLKSLVNLLNTKHYYRIKREFILTTYFFLFKKKILKEVDKLLVKEML